MAFHRVGRSQDQPPGFDALLEGLIRQHMVILTAMIYYSERIQSIISREKGRWSEV